MMSLENDPQKSAEFKTFKPFFFLLFFSLALERFFIKTHRTESRCVIGPENVLFLRHVRASFSPEILLPGTVKGLIYIKNKLKNKRLQDHLSFHSQ